MNSICKSCGQRLYHTLQRQTMHFTISKVSKASFATKNDVIYLRQTAQRNWLKCAVSGICTNNGTRNMSTSSVSEEETKKFSKLAESWWELDGDMMALHTMNSLRIPFIRDCLLYQGYGKPKTSKPLLDVEILEVGCGAGILSEPLARLGASVVGIDSSAEALDAARTHRGDDQDLASLQYLDSWLEDIVAVGSIKFDCVVASEVIEHVEDYRNFVSMCSKVLKPGGSLFISTMNRSNYSYALGIIMAEYILRVVSPGTHTWDKFLKPEEVEQALVDENCSITKIHGMCYDPIRNKWSWANSTELNYILHAVKSPPKTVESNEELGKIDEDEDGVDDKPSN